MYRLTKNNRNVYVLFIVVTGGARNVFIEFAVKSKGKHLDKDSNSSIVLPSMAVFIFLFFF